jgi:Xaa-Pro aminopeptidase
MTRVLLVLAMIVAATGLARADVARAVPARIALSDTPALQGLLAVQRLEGWLLVDGALARRLVSPATPTTHPWFYWIPARGEAVAVVHASEEAAFAHLAGRRVTYASDGDAAAQLRTALGAARTIAADSPPSSLAGLTVRSPDTLVQYTRAIWGEAGRVAHYLAAHHLARLRKEALAYAAKQLAAGTPVTEYELQQRIARGYVVRGLVGPPPVVAAGVNTADPTYVPAEGRTATIQRGDVISIALAARVDQPDGVFAAETWIAVAEATVPGEVKKAFEIATLARDQAIALIADRTRKNRPVTGAEVDHAVRAFVKRAGLLDRLQHRTGHALDGELFGAGTNLDDFEVHDGRILTLGTGFTVGPGLYLTGAFGVRPEVSVFLAATGPEITTPAQDDVEPLLRAP